MEQGDAPPDEDAGPDAGPIDSRDRLITAAVELVVDHHRSGTGLREVFAYLTPGAVAERAGLSRALIYHHWGDTEAGRGSFERFLSEVADRVWELPAVPEELEELAALLPTNMGDLVATLSDHELERATGEDAALFRAGQAITLHGALPLNGGPETIRRLGRLYEALGARLGRRPVPPLTHEDLAMAVSATIEGFALTHNVLPDMPRRRVPWQPAVTPEQAGTDWTLIAIAIEALLRRMTEPVPPDGPTGDQAGTSRDTPSSSPST